MSTKLTEQAETARVEDTTPTLDVGRLERLGLTHAAHSIRTELSMREKLAVAYEHYRYLTPEKLRAFQERLKQETKTTEGKNQWGDIVSYKRTKVTPLENFAKVPPDAVLDALETAKGRGCFDLFEVMELEWHKEVPDPILFGMVLGSPDKFFIAQWDQDIKIEDILNDHEGWKFLDAK